MGKVGFRKIENNLYDALMGAKFSRSDYKVVLTVLNFTAGYQREVSDVSLSTFQKMTGLARTSVIHAIRELESRQVILVNRAGNVSTYSLRPTKDWTGSLHPTSSSSLHATRETGKTGAFTLPELVAYTDKTGSPAETSTTLSKNTKDIRKSTTPPPGAGSFSLNFFERYEKAKGHPLPGGSTTEYAKACSYYAEDWLEDAWAEAEKYKRVTWPYIEAILRRWETDGKGRGRPEPARKTKTVEEVLIEQGRAEPVQQAEEPPAEFMRRPLVMPPSKSKGIGN